MHSLEESLEALQAKVAQNAPLDDEWGQMLFCAVNVARMAGVDAEEALTNASNCFSAQVAACEQQAQQQGKTLQQLTDAQRSEIWMQAK